MIPDATSTSLFLVSFGIDTGDREIVEFQSIKELKKFLVDKILYSEEPFEVHVFKGSKLKIKKKPLPYLIDKEEKIPLFDEEADDETNEEKPIFYPKSWARESLDKE